MLGRVQVDHELAERPFEPRQRTLQDHEPRTRQFRRRLEVHLAERLADLEMLPCGRQSRRLPGPMALHIAAFVGTDRHLGFRQVRDDRKRLLERFSRFALLPFEPRHGLLERGDFGHQSKRARFVLGRLRLADLLRECVAALQGLLQGRHGALPAVVEGDQTLGLRLQAPVDERPVECGGVLADEADVVHGIGPVCPRGAVGRSGALAYPAAARAASASARFLSTTRTEKMDAS